LFGGTITLSVVPAVMTAPEGEQIRRMTPVALISSTPFVLIVAPRLPITTIADLVAYARANPGKLNFGAPAGATPSSSASYSSCVPALPSPQCPIAAPPTP
jgi:tripartite-type tricarboxylate transporter receptor subunit TctC